MTARRLLLVDDDKLIHTVVRAALGKHGYQVHYAFDSVQAPMAARQLKPDVIILDAVQKLLGDA
jgi:DNA-binding response OmpR family regulator